MKIDEELKKKSEEYIEEKKKCCILRVYDNTDDLQYDEWYDRGYINGLKEGYIAGAKENNSVWHKQSNTDDIFDACNDWDIHYFVCKMKDGSYNIAFGNCDEDCNGIVSTNIYFEYEDSKYYLDDIIAWYEIPKFY